MIASLSGLARGAALAALAAALPLAAAGAWSAQAQAERSEDPPPQGEKPDAERSGEREKKPEQAGAGEDTPRKGAEARALVESPRRVEARDFPEGVTLLIERDEEPLDASRFPEGVTSLGPTPSARELAERPFVRIDRERPPLVVPELPAPEELVEGGVRPQLEPEGGTPAAAPEGGRVGPSVEEQQAAFGRPPVLAGSGLAVGNAWQPSSGFPPWTTAEPYPRGTEWAEAPLDPRWEPPSTWLERDAREDMTKSSFPASAIDSRWRPEDAWKRSLGLADPSLAGSLSGPGTTDEEPAEGSPGGEGAAGEEATPPAGEAAPNEGGEPAENQNTETGGEEP